MSKKIAMSSRPQTPEQWVNARPEPTPKGPTKRLTVDIPEESHRRFKINCASQGREMSDVVREMIEASISAQS